MVKIRLKKLRALMKKRECIILVKINNGIQRDVRKCSLDLVEGFSASTICIGLFRWLMVVAFLTGLFETISERKTRSCKHNPYI